MVTNNKYYKTIYENVTGLTVTGHHKNTYYMRGVCEYYGVEYDEFKPLAKYVKDFATALEIDVGSKHKPLRTLLHMIAEELYSGSLEHDTVNYYLKIISENINPPTPIASNITWTLNGVSMGESAILSHADGDDAVFVFTVTDINTHPVSGYQIPIEVNGVAVSPTPVTDANGEATYTYEGSGVGDVAIDVDCTLLTESYTIHDYLKYDDATSDKTSRYDTTNISPNTFSYDSTEQAYKIASNNGWGLISVKDLTAPRNIKITADFKLKSTTSSYNAQPRILLINSTTAKGYGATLHKEHNYQKWELYELTASSPNSSSKGSNNQTYSLDTWYKLELTIETSTITAKLYDNTDTLLNTISTTNSVVTDDNNIVGIGSMYSNNNAFFKNIKVEQL